MSYEDMFSSYILRRQRQRATPEDRDFERERDEEDFARDALNQHRQLEGSGEAWKPCVRSHWHAQLHHVFCS